MHAERRRSGTWAMGVAMDVRYAQAHSYSLLLMPEPVATVSIVRRGANISRTARPGGTIAQHATRETEIIA